jgi:hypothetical protein
MGAPYPYPPSRPQSISEVLDSGFQIFKSTLPTCVPYGMALVIAGQLATIDQIAAGRPLRLALREPRWDAFYLLGVVLELLFGSALLLRQSALAQGQPGNVGLELRTALVRLPALALLIFLCLFLLSAGLLLLIVPGLYLMVPFILAPVCLLLCPTSVLDAIRLGMRFTRGHWWRTAIVLTVVAIVTVVFYVIVIVVAVIALSVSRVTDVALVSAVTSVIGVALGAFLVPFDSAMLLATFGDLRARREGADLERRLAATAVES